jgi:hypothetical protein
MPPKKEAKATSGDTLPSTTLIPNSSLLRRFLTRLPKTVIVDLVLIWLDHPLCPTLPNDEDDDFFDEDESLDDKKAIYETYRDDNSITKKDVIDRILGNDWVTRPAYQLMTETWIECPPSRNARYATPLPPPHCPKMALLRT